MKHWKPKHCKVVKKISNSFQDFVIFEPTGMWKIKFKQYLSNHNSPDPKYWLWKVGRKKRVLSIFLKSVFC